MPEAWKAMDDWCRKQMQALKARSEPHVMSGGDLNDPEYRRLLGQHQAFSRMRSFIHGSTQPHTGGDDGTV